MDRISKAIFDSSTRSVLVLLDRNSRRSFHIRMVQPLLSNSHCCRIRQKNDPRLAITNTIGYSVSLSRGAGLCIAFDCVLIIIPMLRTIITTIYHRFDFLALDENVWFHRQVAYALLFFTIIHVTGFYVNFYRIEELGLRNDDAYSLLYKSWAGITGWIMCLCMFLMYTTATQSIRVMSFETFRYTHALYWVFFVGIVRFGGDLTCSVVAPCCRMFCQKSTD